MAELIAANRPIIYSGYGLAFIIMGWTILFLPRPASRLRLAHSLPFLAFFGLLHGFGEWGHVFIPIQEKFLSQPIIHLLYPLHQLLFATSFLALFLFGTYLISDGNPRLTWLPALPVAIFTFWLIRFLIGEMMITPVSSHGGAAFTEAMGRYMLALPGSLATAVGLLMQVKQFREAGFRPLVSDLRATAAAMTAYAFFAGLLVPTNDFFPANVLNRELFLNWGLPVPIPRAICAALIAFYMIRTLRVFKAEVERQLERAEADRAAAVERERLGRELHDGVLQSIYAAGLGLQAIRRRIDTDPVEAARRVDLTLERLGKIIDEIRVYIKQLDTATTTLDLRKRLANLVEEFELSYGISVIWQMDELSGLHSETEEQVIGIIREALSNAGRHSGARSVSIQVTALARELRLSVTDDGHGFILREALEAEGHFGLRILHKRVRTFGGRLQIESQPGCGTRVNAVLPFLREG